MTGIKETEIASGAAMWLESRDLEIFQEVRGPKTDKRVDLVGRASHNIICVEAKVSLGLDVIAQANHWKYRASETWVAVPRRAVRRTRTFVLARDLCQLRGIGILSVQVGSDGVNVGVQVELEAVRSGLEVSDWNACLHPQQKDSQGGSAGGGYSTDFSRTCGRLVEHVQANPGVELRPALKGIKTHYARIADAVRHLSTALNTQGPERFGALSGIRIEGRGVHARLYPNDSEDF